MMNWSPWELFLCKIIMIYEFTTLRNSENCVSVFCVFFLFFH